MARGLASINIRFFVGLQELSTDLQNATRQLQRAGENMQNVGKSLSLYITAPVVAAGAASLKMASDFEESNNKVNVAFKDSANVVQAFAKTSLTSFGIAEGSAFDMAALFGDMATSMGLTQPAAAKMSTALVGLAGDLASFKNIGIEQATTALNGVFTGETESLKMLGIVMTEANLAQFALSQGITKNIKDFSQAEKVQLRYAYVMAQTTNAQGDFARTGGGAANQMRVFEESLKELGVQVGQVILPAFTGFIKGVNGMLSGLKEMDPETRKVVVTMTALAAATGPVLFGLGAVLKSFEQVRSSAVSLNNVLKANPYTAAAVALGAIVSTTLLATTRLSSLTDVTEEFNKVMQAGSDAIAKESAELNRNLAIAQNEKQSKENRKKAIEALNALSPEYLGNLSLENINTKAATEATVKYTEALKQKSRVMAAQEKLVEVEKKLLDLQMANLDAVKPSIWQELGNRFLSLGDNMRYASLAGQTLGQNLSQETSELEKLQAKLIGFINGNEKFVQSQGNAADATNKLNMALGGPAAGTIAYYEAQIDGLKKIQNEVVRTSAEYGKLQERIDGIQVKIDAIKGKRVVVEVVTKYVKEGGEGAPGPALSEGKENLNFLESEKKKMQEVQSFYAEGEQQFADLQKVIDGYDFTMALKTDPGSIIKAEGFLNQAANMMAIKEAQLEAFAADFSSNLLSIFNATAAEIGVGLGEVIGKALGGDAGIKDAANLMLTALADMVIRIGEMAIQTGIALAGIKAALESLNPVLAITAGVALVALGTFVKSSLKKEGGNIQGFADGGIVGGHSYYGDKIFARLNSGEAIFNRDQQQRLHSMIEPAASASSLAALDVMITGKLSGNDIELMLDRVVRRNKRTR